MAGEKGVSGSRDAGVSAAYVWPVAIPINRPACMLYFELGWMKRVDRMLPLYSAAR